MFTLRSSSSTSFTVKAGESVLASLECTPSEKLTSSRLYTCPYEAVGLDVVRVIVIELLDESIHDMLIQIICQRRFVSKVDVQNKTLVHDVFGIDLPKMPNEYRLTDSDIAEEDERALADASGRHVTCEVGGYTITKTGWRGTSALDLVVQGAVPGF